jgi:transposase-like protein
VPKSHTDIVAAVCRTVFAQPHAEAVSDTWDEVRDQLTGAFPKLGPLMDEAKTEVLAFTAFPRAHWQKFWSTNPPERTRRSSAAPVWSGSSPTPQRSSRGAWRLAVPERLT